MSLFDESAVIENVMIALPEIRARGRNHRVGLRRRGACREAREILDQVGLAERADEEAKALPYGERRALEIGVALAARPSSCSSTSLPRGWARRRREAGRTDGKLRAR